MQQQKKMIQYSDNIFWSSWELKHTAYKLLVLVLGLESRSWRAVHRSLPPPGPDKEGFCHQGELTDFLIVKVDAFIQRNLVDSDTGH